MGELKILRERKKELEKNIKNVFNVFSKSKCPYFMITPCRIRLHSGVLVHDIYHCSKERNSHIRTFDHITNDGDNVTVRYCSYQNCPIKDDI